MRCFLFCALVVIAASGCGGGAGKSDMLNPEVRPSVDLRGFTPAEQAAVRKYIDAFGEDAVDSCVLAYEADLTSVQDRTAAQNPLSKPSQDLAGYLCACVGASTCL